MSVRVSVCNREIFCVPHASLEPGDVDGECEDECGNECGDEHECEDECECED